jgi:hypothetical protein
MRRLLSAFVVIARILSVTVAIFATSIPALAQTEPSQPPRKVVDATFVTVGAMLGAAMAWDVQSTYTVLARCNRCYEANPLARPFINQSEPVGYAAFAVADVGIMAVAAKMKGSKRPWLRRTWWVWPVATVASHAICARHNTQLGRR